MGSPPQRNAALIVAAGRGTRMGPGVDKLFLEIAGRPVIAHSWLAFDRAACIGEVVVVVRPGAEAGFTTLGSNLGLLKPWKVVAGGAERQDSVWNGLMALPRECEIVAIHDGARPCVAEELIAATIAAAREHGAAVAAQPVTDTIKESADGKTIQKTLERARLWAVQTPQTFRVELIRLALAQVRERGVLITDDTAACELLGMAVHLVSSSAPNPKVTRPEDVPYIELLLARRQGGWLPGPRRESGRGGASPAVSFRR